MALRISFIAVSRRRSWLNSAGAGNAKAITTGALP
jgi:hypothetical protein